jgi:hypothetical protein
MVMKKSIFGIVAALCAAFGVAQAQVSNPLGGGSIESENAANIAKMKAAGYIFYQPETMMAKLRAAGFNVIDMNRQPNGDLIYTTVVQNQIFVWAFLECAGSDCFIFRPIYVMPLSLMGAYVSADQVNALNVNVPVGFYLASEKGDVALRNSLLAIPECATACQEQHVMQFISSAEFANETISELIGRQRTASAPTEQKSSVAYRQLVGALGQSENKAGDRVTAHTQSTDFQTDFPDGVYNFNLVGLVYDDVDTLIIEPVWSDLLK